MKAPMTLQLAQALVSPSLFFVWKRDTAGKDVVIETAQLVKDCYFGGDNPHYKEWARLTLDIMEACKLLEAEGLEGEFGVFGW